MNEQATRGHNESVLAEMITALADSFTAERQKEKPYKELFKAGSTHTGLLRKLDLKMTNHVLDACHVYEQRHGISLNKKQFHILLALPLLVQIAQKDAERNEGRACCVDKAFYMLSEQIIALGDAVSSPTCGTPP